MGRVPPDRRYSTAAHRRPPFAPFPRPPIARFDRLNRPCIPIDHQLRSEYGVPVNEDCRHYIMQTTSHEEKLERCRMGANEQIPFGCPEGCLFYEPRKVSGAGWTIRTTDER